MLRGYLLRKPLRSGFVLRRCQLFQQDYRAIQNSSSLSLPILNTSDGLLPATNRT